MYLRALVQCVMAGFIVSARTLRVGLYVGVIEWRVAV